VTALRRRQLLLGLSIAVLAALTLRAGQESQRAAPPSPVPSVTNPGPQGLLAAWRYLRLHGKAEPLESPFTALPDDAQVLVTALPYAQPVESAEREALLRWVASGGTLVLLAQHQRGLGGALGDLLDPTFVALHLNDREVGLTEIGRDVKSLLDAAARPEDVERVPARPALPDPLLAGVGTLGVSAGRGFDAAPGEAVPLAVAGDTPVVLSLDHGRGRVLLLAGPDVFTNARLDLGDNLQLLANLGQRGAVYFDEFHHREAPSVALASLARAFGPAALAALVCGALLVLAVGRRLGPPLDAPPSAARSSRDYALQLGRLYARAGAEPELVGDLLRELRQRARDRAHLPALADDAEVAARLRPDDPAGASRYLSLCADLADAARGHPDPERFAALAREAAALRGAL
jgi:hypothetical protein